MTVALNDAVTFLMRRYTGLAAGLLLATAGGCGFYSSVNVNDILDAQIREQNGVLTTDTSRVLLVNQTQNTIELDILVDGTPVTITVTPQDERTTYTPSFCPYTIEVVEERRLNSLGAFVGGRNYNHNEAFVFTETEFDCQSTIVITFTEDGTTPAVL